MMNEVGLGLRRVPRLGFLIGLEAKSWSRIDLFNCVTVAEQNAAASIEGARKRVNAA